MKCTAQGPIGVRREPNYSGLRLLHLGFNSDGSSRAITCPRFTCELKSA
jgi:hypothetical protein